MNIALCHLPSALQTAVPHIVAPEQPSGDSAAKAAGASSQSTAFTIPRITYARSCTSVADHAKAGGTQERHAGAAQAAAAGAVGAAHEADASAAGQGVGLR